LVVTGVPEQTKLGGLVDSTSVGGLSFLPGYGAASVFNNRNKVLVEIPKKVSCWTFDCKKKKITRNCTQYSLAWVFLPFVHVVKF